MQHSSVIASMLMMVTVGSLAYPAHGQLEQTQLTVEISGVNEPEGQVCLNLFDSRDGFPSNREQAVQTTCLALTEDLLALAKDIPLEVTFADLTPGSYAVSVFHDANGDNEFNRNFVGMPAEGFGFSRNPDVLTGPPEFGEAVFLVAGTETSIEVALSYF